MFLLGSLRSTKSMLMRTLALVAAARTPEAASEVLAALGRDRRHNNYAERFSRRKTKGKRDRSLKARANRRKSR